MIVLISPENDPHVGRVMSYLQAKQSEYYHLSMSRFPLSFGLSQFNDEHGKSCFLQDSHTRLPWDQVRAVWHWRSGKPSVSRNQGHPDVQAYVQSESETFLRNSLQLLNRAFWLSDAEAIERAHNKSLQLKIARSLGFLVPDTFMGNDPEAAEAWLKNRSEVIVKSVNRPDVRLKLNAWQKAVLFCEHLFSGQGLLKQEDMDKHVNSYSLHTRKYQAQDLIQNVQGIQNCPVILQVYIPKAYELRITIVGERIFPCAIDSQAGSNEAKVDWRTETHNLTHRAVELPESIQVQCLQLLKKLNLHYGAIDMIVTPNGEYVFLEINPVGTWLWIEDQLGFPISEAIAEMLISHDTVSNILEGETPC